MSKPFRNTTIFGLALGVLYVSPSWADTNVTFSAPGSQTISDNIGTVTFNANGDLTVTAADLSQVSVDSIQGTNVGGSTITFTNGANFSTGSLGAATAVQQLYVNASGTDGEIFNIGGTLLADKVLVSNSISGITYLRNASDAVF